MIKMEFWYREAQAPDKDLSQGYPYGSLEAFEGSLSGERIQAWLLQTLGERGVEEIARKYPEEDQMVGVLLGVYVDEEDQGRGYGTRILKDFLNRTDASLIFLVADTRESGPRLLQWYEGFGFRQFGKTEFPPGHPVMILET